jgi:hypothetical protein
MTEQEALQWVIKDLEKKKITTLRHLDLALERKSKPIKHHSEMEVLESKIKMFEINIKGFTNKIEAFKNISDKIEKGLQ